MAEGSFVSVVAVTTEHNVAKRTAWRSDTLNFGVAEVSVPRWQGSVVDSGAAEYGGGQFSRCGGMTEQNVAAKRSVAAGGAKQPRSAAESVAGSGSVAECYRSASCGRGAAWRSAAWWHEAQPLAAGAAAWRGGAQHHSVAERSVAA